MDAHARRLRNGENKPGRSRDPHQSLTDNTGTRSGVQKGLGPQFQTQVETGVEGRSCERTASLEHVNVACHEAEALAVSGETMSAIWGGDMEVNAGPHSQDYISRTGPCEVVP